MLSSNLRYIAGVIILASTAAAMDVVVTDRNGNFTRVTGVGFYMGPLSAPGSGFEKRGVVVAAGHESPAASLARYCKQETLGGMVGRSTLYYVPWDSIDEVEILLSDPPDHRRFPSKLRMNDGKTFEANVIVNGSTPEIAGKGVEGEIHILLSTISSIKAIKRSINASISK